MENEILRLLPYSAPFLFVDELERITENGITGNYTFPEDSFFYRGHFKGNPVTPGAILTECAAQIGVVCLGIVLLKDQEKSGLEIALTGSKMDFFKAVFPGEKVRVISEKVYFRFNKLKCSVKMYNSDEELVCRGEIAGMFRIDE